LLVVTVVCYLSTFALSGLLFMWFNPSGHDCGLNVFFIVITLILAFGFAIVALHPQVTDSDFIFKISRMFVVLKWWQ
jgi:serine incorporator 1/3